MKQLVSLMNKLQSIEYKYIWQQSLKDTAFLLPMCVMTFGKILEKKQTLESCTVKLVAIISLKSLYLYVHVLQKQNTCMNVVKEFVIYLLCL